MQLPSCGPQPPQPGVGFLGANWQALYRPMGLGLLFVIHIIYALCLTIQNRKARGNDAYKVNSRPASVEWSSQNMLVLGIVVVAFLGVHLCSSGPRCRLRKSAATGMLMKTP